MAALLGCGDDVYVPYGPHHQYVVDSLQLPTTIGEAGSDAVYFDGEYLDNELGMFLASLAQGYALPRFGAQAIQGPNTAAIDQRALITLVDLQAPDLAATSADRAGLSIYRGALAGSASFAVAATFVADRPIVGEISDGSFHGDRGHITVQLMLGSAPVALPLVNAMAKLTGVTDDAIDGVLGGLISYDTRDNVIAPALIAGLVAPAIARDCCGTPTSPEPTCSPNGMPRCGCVGGSTGEALIRLLVPNDATDCSISADALASNFLFQQLVSADVWLDGAQWISFGLHFTAVSASFTTP
jgi:hypothetical protein